MSYRINGNLVKFDSIEFKRLLGEETSYREKAFTYALEKFLSKTTNPVASRDEVIEFLKKIPHDLKLKSKYKKLIKYVVFHWPNMIPLNKVVKMNAIMPRLLGFEDFYATKDGNTDFTDLIYGASSGRSKPIYQKGGQPRQADHLNNASNLGTGVAFQTTWHGTGLLNASPETVVNSFRQGQPQSEWKGGVTNNTRNAYVNGLLGTRYSPENVFKLQNIKVVKDTYLPLDVIISRNFNNDGIPPRDNVEERFWAHARFIKSVRSACKGGIAMVASSPLYTGINARVHFVLDTLGDLGVRARKDSRNLNEKDNFVAITTSELCFCFRYWMNSEFPLKEVVFFYVNGLRVHPPWDFDWSITDASGHKVYSNQEAWLRYGLFLEVMGSAKPFPKFDIGQENLGDAYDFG
jgi:hypothetical protein